MAYKTNKIIMEANEIDRLSAHYGWTVREKQRVEDLLMKQIIAFTEWKDKNYPQAVVHEGLVKLFLRNESLVV